jgi:hypothetical protein
MSKNKQCFCSQDVRYETIDEMDCVVNKWTKIFDEILYLVLLNVRVFIDALITQDIEYTHKT